MAAPTVKQTTVTTSTGGASTTVSAVLPTLVNGDTCRLWISRASNNLLTAGTAAALGFVRYGSKVGNSSTSPQGELWVATGLTAASSGATVTFTSSQSRNYRVVAEALDPCNMAVYVSTGSLAGVEYTWGTTSGNLAPTVGNLVAPTEALMTAFLFDASNTARSVSGSGWTEQNEGASPIANITYLYLANKTVAVSGTVTGPTISRDDTTNTAGVYPFGQVAFVSAASNVIPTVTAIAREVVGTVGAPVTDPSLTNHADGTFTFTPTAPISYTFSCTATDDDGGVSVAALVSVLVTYRRTRARAAFSRSGGLSPRLRRG